MVKHLFFVSIPSTCVGSPYPEGHCRLESKLLTAGASGGCSDLAAFIPKLSRRSRHLYGGLRTFVSVSPHCTPARSGLRTGSAEVHPALCSAGPAAPGAPALCSAEHVRRPAWQEAAAAVGSGSLLGSPGRSGCTPSLCQSPHQTAGWLGSGHHL